MGVKIELDEKEVEEVYRETGSYLKTAEHFGISIGPIQRVLKSLGYELSRRRYFTDQSFFDVIDSEIKAYWLGYLAADGTIRYRHHQRLNGRLRGSSILLKLSVNDVEHLKLFKDLVSPSTPLKYATSYVTTRKGNLSTSHCVILSLNSNHMVEQIMDKGVGPRKTHTIGRPNISDEYIPYFIRGLFDGDGTCSVRPHHKENPEKLTLRYSIATASKDMQEFLSEELGKVGIEVRVSGINVYISKLQENIRFYHYLYDNVNTHLTRKKETADVFITQHNEIKEWEIQNQKKHYFRKSVVWTDEEQKTFIENYKNGISVIKIGNVLPNKTQKQLHHKLENLRKQKIV